MRHESSYVGDEGKNAIYSLIFIFEHLVYVPNEKTSFLAEL